MSGRVHGDSFTRSWLLAAMVPFVATCGGPAGDNSAVRAFYPTVKVGTPLAEAIAAGEKAQVSDIRFSVTGRDCPGDSLYVLRGNELPSIRVVHPQSNVDTPWGGRSGYHEVGYATREDFSAALQEAVPRFLTCKAFTFTFGRNQRWPSSDSFWVTVDAQGRIATVSPLAEDRVE
jgi:hypothetical protein